MSDVQAFRGTPVAAAAAVAGSRLSLDAWTLSP
jgi:hypothetical protein